MKRLILLSAVVAILSWAGMDFSKLSNGIEETRLEVGTIIRHSTETPEWDTKNVTNLKGEPTPPAKVGWGITNTSLDEVEKTLNFSVIPHIFGLIKRYPKKKFVVIAMGCGRGRAANDLVKRLNRLKVKNVKVYGVSDLYFPDWSRTRGVEYIFDRFHNLYKYLEEDSVGVVFSHFGLYHISGDATVDLLVSLSPYIMDGGIVITNETVMNKLNFWKLVPFYSQIRYETQTMNGRNEVYQWTRRDIPVKDMAILGSVETHMKQLKFFTDSYGKDFKELCDNIRVEIMELEDNDLRGLFTKEIFPLLGDAEFWFPDDIEKAKLLVDEAYAKVFFLYRNITPVGCGVVSSSVPLI